MIPYAEFDRALARWKVRKAGGDARMGGSQQIGDGASGVYESFVGEELSTETSSGMIAIGDAEIDDSETQ